MASPETVDEMVRLGLARRLHLTPFETAALGGAATFEAARTLTVAVTATSVSGLGRWLATTPNASAPEVRA